MSIDLRRTDASSVPNVHALRACLGQFATGVAVVTYRAEDGPRGLTVNSFTSVSLDPPLVLVCLDKRSRALAWVSRGPFTVNVLNAGQRDMAWHFAGRQREGVSPAWQRTHSVPRLRDSLAWLACEPWSQHEAGDHVIVVGRVVEFGTGDGRPLCFFRGQFVELPKPARAAAASANPDIVKPQERTTCSNS